MARRDRRREPHGARQHRRRHRDLRRARLAGPGPRHVLARRRDRRARLGTRGRHVPRHGRAARAGRKTSGSTSAIATSPGAWSGRACSRRARRRPRRSRDLAARIGVRATVLPMCDEQVRTWVRVDERWTAFQEFMIRTGAQGDDRRAWSSAAPRRPRRRAGARGARGSRRDRDRPVQPARVDRSDPRRARRPRRRSPSRALPSWRSARSSADTS